MPLVRPARLWPALRRSLSVTRHGSLDLRCLLVSITRGQLIPRLPRLARTDWGGALIVVRDNSERLHPYYEDYNDLLREIVMRRGTIGMRVVLVDGVPACLDQKGASYSNRSEKIAGKKVTFIHGGNRLPIPVCGTQMLLLSDLGFMSDTPAIAEQWRYVIAQLCHAGATPIAWVPCSGRLVESATSHLMRIYALDPAESLRPQCGRPLADEQRSAVHQRLGELREKLLTRLACCLSMQPNLLRGMRMAFADTVAEPALEGIIWSHQPVVCSSAVSRPLAPDHQMQYRNTFARSAPDEQREILRCIRYWHGWEGRSTETFETLIWECHAHRDAVKAEVEALTKAKQWLDAFSVTMGLCHSTDSNLRIFARAILARNFHDEVWMGRHSTTLARMWALCDWKEIPRGLRAADITRALNCFSSIPSMDYRLWQIGAELWLLPAELQIPKRTVSRCGSLIRAKGLHVEEADGQARWIDFDGQAARICNLADIGGQVVLSVQDWSHVIITHNRPTWATEYGRDRYGLYAEFTIKTRHGQAIQRLRWIEPGTFLMGSPDSEPGRYSDEGPQHPVTLTRGFWLADTACTQALWQAVTGENPSRFREQPGQPVEQVSWNEVQDFLAELNRRLPGLEARLPSEAEWEYACRAGTTTPFSFGENITAEQVNYDGNHPYAGGVKGVYRLQTVPVGSLPANPWGLYEMHGNVCEWCADWYGDYPTTPQVDPRGAPSGDARVFRGGSCNYFGRDVRSAVRRRREPGGHYGSVGFRLALGPGKPAEPA